MKRRISKIKQDGKFIRLPQRETGIFDLPSDLFKFYAWLLSHEDNFEIRSDYFISKGIKIDPRSIDKYLKKLSSTGWITISQSTIIICQPPTSSLPTSSPTNSQPPTSSLPTNSSQPPTNNSQPPIKIVVGDHTNKIIKENKGEDKGEDNVINSNIGKIFSSPTSQELISMFVKGDAQEILRSNYIRFKFDNKDTNLSYQLFESIYIFIIYLINLHKGNNIKSDDKLETAILNTNYELINIVEMNNKLKSNEELNSDLNKVITQFILK